LQAHGVTSGASQATAKKAAQACASLKPSTSGVTAELQKFLKCLSSHGVNLPTGSSGDSAAAAQQAISKMQGSKAQAALAACAQYAPTP
jgi:hypothetical protein